MCMCGVCVGHTLAHMHTHMHRRKDGEQGVTDTVHVLPPTLCHTIDPSTPTFATTSNYTCNFSRLDAFYNSR